MNGQKKIHRCPGVDQYKMCMNQVGRKYLGGVFALAVSCLMSASCSFREQWPSGQGETATVLFSVPMLTEATKVPVNGDENAINQLRVIILSPGAKSINRLFTKEEIIAAGGSFVLENVPVGDVQLYVIANETGLGRDYTELSALQNELVDLPENQKKVLIRDADRAYFPKRGSEFPEGGLPMTWMDKNLKIDPPGDTPQKIQVPLQRCVAKLNIEMQSTLSEEIVITTMNFGPFFGDKLYLFQETNLDVPADASYGVKEYDGLDIRIPANGSETLVCYIYPSFAWTSDENPSPYTIGFSTASGKEYQPRAFVADYGILNSIARNTQVNILAKLSSEADITLDFEVVPWVEKTVDVPSFN